MTNVDFNQLFNTFAQAMNQNVASGNTAIQQNVAANNAALQHAFETMLQQAQQQGQHVQAEPVIQAPSTPESPKPVVIDPVETPNPHEYVIGDKLYDLVMQIMKPCKDCPFSAVCDLKPSIFGADCHVDGMKQAAVEAGIIDVHVTQDENFKFYYPVYKNNLFIGNVAIRRETNELRAELEKYVGKVVKLSTQLTKEQPNYTLTNLHAEIMDILDAPEETKVEETSVVKEPVQVDEPADEPTISLGDMVSLNI